MEQDSVRYRSVELRAAEDGPEGAVVGYVTKFEPAYNVFPGLREKIAPGAFEEDLKASDGAIPLFWQHDHYAGPIGVGVVKADDTGYLLDGLLFIEDDPRARGVFRAMEKRALREWSVGFLPSEIVATEEEDGTVLETITSARLLESSVVMLGANPNTETLDVRKSQAAPEATEAPAAPAAPVVPEFLLARLDETHVRSIVADLLARRAA